MYARVDFGHRCERIDSDILAHCNTKGLLSHNKLFPNLEAIHPNQIWRKRGSEKLQMDVFGYLFIHAQRLTDKSLLRPINTHKYSTKTRHNTNETAKQNITDKLKALDVGKDATQAEGSYGKGG